MVESGMNNVDKEFNQIYAKELSRLIQENPQMPVLVMIDSEGIDDEYGWYAGNIGMPRIRTIVHSKITDQYVEKDGDAYEDCAEYYGLDADEWDTETLERKAKEIPWETVITVYVSAVN